MDQPTPIVFYLPATAASIDGSDRVDVEDLLNRIGAADVERRQDELYGGWWADLDVIASAQTVDGLVRFIVEISSMDWIDMRLRNPDRSLMFPERARRLLDGFAEAADSLGCVIGFKSMTVLPEGWVSWDLFLPDFDRVAAYRIASELVREPIDFGYVARDLEDSDWALVDDVADTHTMFGSSPGVLTDRGVVWFGERLPDLV